MPMRIWSKGRPLPNTANVLAKTVLPELASPAAMLIMFCSAGPMSKKRSGNCSANRLMTVDLFRSPPSTTMSGFSLPSSSRVRP